MLTRFRGSGKLTFRVVRQVSTLSTGTASILLITTILCFSAVHFQQAPTDFPFPPSCRLFPGKPFVPRGRANLWFRSRQRGLTRPSSRIEAVRGPMCLESAVAIFCLRQCRWLSTRKISSYPSLPAQPG